MHALDLKKGPSRFSSLTYERFYFSYLQSQQQHACLARLNFIEKYNIVQL